MLGLEFLPEKVRVLCLSGGDGPPTTDLESVKAMIATSCGYTSSPDRPVRRNVAYFKSHKTGSGTIFTMLLAAGVRHGLKVVHGDELEGKLIPRRKGGFEPNDGKYFSKAACPTRDLPAKYRHAFNVEVRHVTAHGTMFDPRKAYPCDDRQGLFFDNVVQSYEFLIEEPFIATSFRSPMELAMSAAKFYQLRNLTTEAAFNPASHDFGLYEPKHVERFIEKFLDSGKVFPIILERIDESVTLMRRMLNVDLIDVIYPERALHQGAAINATIDPHSVITPAVITLDINIYAAATRAFDSAFRKHLGGAEGLQEVLVYKSLMRHISYNFCRRGNVQTHKPSEVICKILLDKHGEGEMFRMALWPDKYLEDFDAKKLEELGYMRRRKGEGGEQRRRRTAGGEKRHKGKYGSKHATHGVYSGVHKSSQFGDR